MKTGLFKFIVFMQCSLLFVDGSINGNLFNVPKAPPPACKEIDWAVWSSVAGNSAAGAISSQGNNVGITINSSFDLESTSQIWRHEEFKRYKAIIPNATVPRTSWSKAPNGTITVWFTQSVKEPVLLLASLGNYKERIATTIRFSEPYVVLHNAGGIIEDNNNTLTGREGYALIKFPGDIKCITISSSTYESFTDLTWGVPVCPEGIPKPVSKSKPTTPELPVMPVAAAPKPVVKAAEPEPVPKPVAALPKPEPVVASLPKPVVKIAESEPLPKPVASVPKPEPVVVSLPKPVVQIAEAAPVPKPVAAVPKPEPVVASLPKPAVKAVEPAPVPKPVAAVPKPEPVVALLPKPVVKIAESEPVPKPVAAVPKPEPVVASLPKPVVKAVEPAPVPKPVAALPKPEPVIASLPKPVVKAVEPAPVPKPVAAVPKPEPVVASLPKPAVKAFQTKPVAAPKPVASVLVPKPELSKPMTIVRNAGIKKELITADPRPAPDNNLLKVELSDYDGMDYDSVSLKLNGKPIGPQSIQLQLSRRNGMSNYTYQLHLQAGENTLEIYAIGEGLKPLTTVCIQIFYDDKPKKLYFGLKAKETTLIRL
ncbi:MAG: hypothetical protein H7Y13_17735 [Sphingobacteriaceae bacterium]|nr:hypothetical protein [Sphingobacteriaceae bacterium]